MAKTGHEGNSRKDILNTLRDENGKYYHILNRVFCRKIYITNIELDGSGTKFHITMDLSNFNIEDATEVSPDVLWDCFYLREAFNECFSFLKSTNLFDPSARKPLPVIDDQKLKNMSESKIQKLKKFLEDYGYPFTVGEDELKEALSCGTNKVKITMEIKDLLLQINLVDETFLIYVFLMQKNHQETKYTDVFCERSKKYAPFFKHYSQHGLNIMKQNISKIQLSPVLAQTDENKKMYYYLINQNPIDAALHHILLLISNDSGYRIRRCSHCHEYFEFTHANSKYCNRKQCNRQNNRSEKKRQKKLNDSSKITGA